LNLLNRRSFLASLPALAFSPRLVAQSARPNLSIVGINHVTIRVPDLKRSVEFYQTLFGMPVAARQGTTTISLQIGKGPQSLAISQAAPGAGATIDHYCVGTINFDVDQTLSVLEKWGFTKAGERSPMKMLVRMRGPEAGGAPGGTPEIYLVDADGLVVQLQDRTYCGGAGPLGNACSSPEPAPTKGLIPLAGWSHLTMFVPDAKKSTDFYLGLFGTGVRSFQGPTAPTLAVGGNSTVQFLMYTGGGAPGAAPRPASINHFCMNLEGFNVEDIQKKLESVGIKPRDTQVPGPAGPMQHYVSMRMPNRGGAPEGTPELYFTDPDGLLVQLQDVKYCGGSGLLGETCPPVRL
jgi:catechol 2,3-dioxygenase-like lactoylglutathione lyase family enzyme